MALLSQKFLQFVLKKFLLVEDFGDTTFFEALKTSNSDALYDQAEKSLFKMQQIYPSESSLVTYDLEKVLDELALFETWFLKAIGYSKF